MADTIITNTPTPSNGEGGGAGWVVALVIVIAIAVGGVLLYQNGFFKPSAPQPAGTTNINVTVPPPTTPPTTNGYVQPK